MWSVVAASYATAVTDPTEIERHAHLLQARGEGTASDAIQIRPDLVTGFRLRESKPVVVGSLANSASLPGHSVRRPVAVALSVPNCSRGSPPA